MNRFLTRTWFFSSIGCRYWWRCCRTRCCCCSSRGSTFEDLFIKKRLLERQTDGALFWEECVFVGEGWGGGGCLLPLLFNVLAKKFSLFLVPHRYTHFLTPVFFQHGFIVTLVEASKELGGRLRQARVRGWDQPVDIGVRIGSGTTSLYLYISYSKFVNGSRQLYIFIYIYIYLLSPHLFFFFCAGGPHIW